MEKISGYAAVIINHRIKKDATKSLFGKPTLKYAHCLAMSAYFMQVGAILAAKYRNNFDAFGHAFLGTTGDEGAMQRLANDSIDLIVNRIKDGMTFFHYVIEEQIERIQYPSSSANFLLECGPEKLDLETAHPFIKDFAMEGTFLGACRPELALKLFEEHDVPVNSQEWNRAREAGLNIPEKQTLMSWSEVQDAEDEVFIEYCKQCAPPLYTILKNG